MISIDPHRRLRKSFAPFLAILCLWTAGSSVLMSGQTEKKEPIRFELEDQFNRGMLLKPAFTKRLVVTVADEKGYEQLPDWIASLKKEFGDSVQFFAVADLRAVPGWLKGMVRRGFRKKIAHGVAMDWDGAAANQMDIIPDQANLLLLDQDGRVSFSIHGEATEENLSKLKDAIQTAIRKNPSLPIPD